MQIQLTRGCEKKICDAKTAARILGMGTPLFYTYLSSGIFQSSPDGYRGYHVERITNPRPQYIFVYIYAGDKFMGRENLTAASKRIKCSSVTIKKYLNSQIEINGYTVFDKFQKK